MEVEVEVEVGCIRSSHRPLSHSRHSCQPMHRCNRTLRPPSHHQPQEATATDVAASVPVEHETQAESREPDERSETAPAAADSSPVAAIDSASDGTPEDAASILLATQ